MRVIPELVSAVKTSRARRPAAGAIGTVRVDVAQEEHKTLYATYKTEDKSFQLVMDYYVPFLCIINNLFNSSDIYLAVTQHYDSLMLLIF